MSDKTTGRDALGYLRWTPTSCGRCGYERADCTCPGGFVDQPKRDQSTVGSYAEWERGYQQGYDDAVNHAVNTIERIPRERGWTGARLVSAIGTLAATVRSLSPVSGKSA